ncbi:MAG: hypothetical protein JO218_19175, partial [Burkholderiales bacterium]|nr:hypothetical protein [Burkholderiales bacterium]
MFGVRTSVRFLAVSVAALMSLGAHGQGLSSGNDPSLLLMIWDPVNKVSYTRDTGLTGATLYNGLSNAGSQQFWTLNPSTDASFAQFLNASPDLSQDEWMVFGGGKSALGTGPGSNVAFTTMINTVLVDNQPTLNPEWSLITSITNNTVRSKAANFSVALYTPLMRGNGTAYNNYATAASGTGSSFDTPSSTSYIGNLTQLLSNPTDALSSGDGFGTPNAGYDIGNLIGASGSSSWFYYLTPSSTSTKTTVLSTVSAFSNSAQDAYWGLARTTNSNNQQELVLSFTLPSAVTQTTTILGAIRRNQTDYTAQYGVAQQ